MKIKLHNPRLDKETRLLTQSSRFEAGQVHLPRHAPWLGKYVDELLGAPFCAYWDQVDSTTQALEVLLAQVARKRPLVRRNITRRYVVRRDQIDQHDGDEPEKRDRSGLRSYDGPPSL